MSTDDRLVVADEPCDDDLWSQQELVGTKYRCLCKELIRVLKDERERHDYEIDDIQRAVHQTKLEVEQWAHLREAELQEAVESAKSRTRRAEEEAAQARSGRRY